MLYALVMATVINGITFENVRLTGLSQAQCERERVTHYLDDGRKPNSGFFCFPMTQNALGKAS
jgi:hypothetical protein